MKTLDIIRWLTVSLAALVAVIFAAGWVSSYYPTDLSGNLNEISESEVGAMRAFDFRDPRGDAERAIKKGEFRLWPFQRVNFEPGFIATFELHFIPVGISCEDLIKPYRVAEQNHPDFPTFQSHEYFPDQILFASEQSRLAEFSQKYIYVDISSPEGSHEVIGFFEGNARAYSELPKDNRFELKTAGNRKFASHPSVKAFRENYLFYAAVYNQRMLKERPLEISAQWGTSLLCAAVPIVNGHQIIRDTLYRNVMLVARVRMRDAD